MAKEAESTLTCVFLRLSFALFAISSGALEAKRGYRMKRPFIGSCLSLFLLGMLFPSTVLAATQSFNWVIQYANVTRFCNTKSVVTVNGLFPGPTMYVNEGDSVTVNVTNMVDHNVTIHWHGLRQLLTAWADGPAYITQCPIQTGKSYVHKFQIVGQRGTLFWHAHISWLRATLHGAFIIRPQTNGNYPFSTPTQELPIILGEWWNEDVEEVEAQALSTGAGYTIPEAITINGQPGALYGNCSLDGTVVMNVTKGKTYLLRVINAGLNFQMYFAVANHSLTVVEADAEYTKPYVTNTILLAPGQTTNVLFTANQSVGQYYMAASVYSPAPASLVPYPTTATTAILTYANASANSASSLALPAFPAVDDTNFALTFTQSIRVQSYSTGYYYMDVPQTVNQSLFYTLSYNYQPCVAGQPCVLPGNVRLAASVNNVSFVTPTMSILQAYYNQISGVYTTDFPDNPPYAYDFTAVNPDDKFSVMGTMVKVLEFNTTVQIVFQDTATLFFESHPVHLHGQNFYIVGVGEGTFDPTSDPANFNLADPPSRNTMNVPSGGWAAIRFRTLNPGVWYMHCHIDMHTSWGMSMAFIVKNGVGTSQTLPAPPADLPPC